MYEYAGFAAIKWFFMQQNLFLKNFIFKIVKVVVYNAG